MFKVIQKIAAKWHAANTDLLSLKPQCRSMEIIVVWFFAYNVLDSQIFSFLQNNEAKCLRNQGIEANWLEWTKFLLNRFFDTNSVTYMVKLAHIVICYPKSTE